MISKEKKGILQGVTNKTCVDLKRNPTSFFVVVPLFGLQHAVNIEENPPNIFLIGSEFRVFW